MHSPESVVPVGSAQTGHLATAICGIAIMTALAGSQLRFLRWSAASILPVTK